MGRCNDIVKILLPYTVALPLWIRFWQCARRFWFTGEAEHLANSLKYFSSLSTHVLGALHPAFEHHVAEWDIARILWFVTYFLATTYLYTWDITMDWGLGRLRSKNFFLRDRLIYPKSWYWLAIFFDGAARYSWLWGMTAYKTTVIPSNYYFAIFAYEEILRRSMWGLIRMENEHINNCGKFRATLEVPLPFQKNIDTDQIVRVATSGTPVLWNRFRSSAKKVWRPSDSREFAFQPSHDTSSKNLQD